MEQFAYLLARCDAILPRLRLSWPNHFLEVQQIRRHKFFSNYSFLPPQRRYSQRYLPLDLGWRTSWSTLPYTFYDTLLYCRSKRFCHYHHGRIWGKYQRTRTKEDVRDQRSRRKIEFLEKFRTNIRAAWRGHAISRTYTWTTVRSFQDQKKRTQSVTDSRRAQ